MFDVTSVFRDNLISMETPYNVKKGEELEKKLSDIQIKKIRNVLLNFNEIDINGFKKILYEMVNDANKIKFNEINKKYE